MSSYCVCLHSCSELFATSLSPDTTSAELLSRSLSISDVLCWTNHWVIQHSMYNVYTYSYHTSYSVPMRIHLCIGNLWNDIIWLNMAVLPARLWGEASYCSSLLTGIHVTGWCPLSTQVSCFVRTHTPSYHLAIYSVKINSSSCTVNYILSYSHVFLFTPNLDKIMYYLWNEINQYEFIMRNMNNF